MRCSLVFGVSATLALAGCSGDLPSGYTDLCSGGRLEWIEGVETTPPYDSLEVYVGSERIQGRGTPCASAKDATACRTQYSGVRGRAAGTTVITTRGADVVSGGPTLVFFGGSIDTVQEAAVFVLADPNSPVCQRDQIGAIASGDGFDVAKIMNDPCGNPVRETTHVSKTGKIRSVGRERVRGAECPIAGAQDPTLAK